MSWELGRVPDLLVRLGEARPTSPVDIGAPQLRAIREKTGWEKATIALHFAALRQFLKWAGSPLAGEPGHWRLPSGEPSRRRWLTKEQLLQLYSKSEGLGRLLVALEGFNGLRRVETLRLRVRDVLLAEDCLRVLGKGRNGGKWRKIPLHPVVRELLESQVRGKAQDNPVIPLSRSGADLALRRSVVCSGLLAAGTRVSHHDLRRTFGRLAHAAGMDLVQLKNLFGHASIEMTVHYIGLDAEEMRLGLARLNQHLGLG